jgi:hypothetical protein
MMLQIVRSNLPWQLPFVSTNGSCQGRLLLTICNIIPNSQCNKINSSYECNCVTGYEKLTNGSCQGRLLLTICNIIPISQCNKLNGSYECNCVTGYEKLTNGSCQGRLLLTICNIIPNSQCNNMNGSYECNCVTGYEKLTNRSCQGRLLLRLFVCMIVRFTSVYVNQCLSPLTLWVFISVHGQVKLIKLYVMKFVSYLLHVVDFLRVIHQ